MTSPELTAEQARLRDVILALARVVELDDAINSAQNHANDRYTGIGWLLKSQAGLVSSWQSALEVLEPLAGDVISNFRVEEVRRGDEPFRQTRSTLKQITEELAHIIWTMIRDEPLGRAIVRFMKFDPSEATPAHDTVWASGMAQLAFNV